MTETKPWYKSQTVDSIIVMIAIVCTQFFGVEILEAELQEIVAAIGFVISGISAIIGRFKARKALTPK